MQYRKIFQIIVAIAIPNAGGVVGALLFPPDGSWYEELKKPKFVPPNWVFPIAWILFYCTMGFASYLACKNGGGSGDCKYVPLMFYIVQLLLNWAWTPLFFGLHSIKGSLIDISTLVVAAVACAFAFYKINRVSGLLMIPYVLWLGFATLLNICIFQLN